MAGFHSRPRQHSRLLEPDHCRRLWEMPCILQLAVKAVFMEPGSCTQLRAAEPCCGSRLHVAGFYSRTRADGYQDPATRPGPAVTTQTRMRRARCAVRGSQIAQAVDTGDLNTPKELPRRRRSSFVQKVGNEGAPSTNVIF